MLPFLFFNFIMTNYGWKDGWIDGISWFITVWSSAAAVIRKAGTCICNVLLRP